MEWNVISARATKAAKLHEVLVQAEWTANVEIIVRYGRPIADNHADKPTSQILQDRHEVHAANLHL